MATLVTLVSEAVRLRALLKDRPRRRSQNETQYELQVRRVRWLRDELLKGVKLKAIFESGVRNSIEHFDEYLDDVSAKCYKGAIPRPTMVPLDFVVGRRKTLEQFPVTGERAHVENLRVYIASERVFVNAGREISIRSLRDEARRIVKRLKPLLPADITSTERGSSLFVLTDKTFRPQSDAP